jgi:hypothetical protein
MIVMLAAKASETKRVAGVLTEARQRLAGEAKRKAALRGLPEGVGGTGATDCGVIEAADGDRGSGR